MTADSKPIFEKLALIGIGLIGSSISHACRRAGLAAELTVRGYHRVVLAGQSYGAFLQMMAAAASDDCVDTVPALHELFDLTAIRAIWPDCPADVSADGKSLVLRNAVAVQSKSDSPFDSWSGSGSRQCG